MSTSGAPVRSRNWIWYFIGLALVAGVLLLWLALFIRQQLETGSQLKVEDVKAALERWRARGPKSYDMVYAVKRGGQAAPDLYYVEVRDGQGRRAVLNGVTELAADQLEYRTMMGLFRDIERFLQYDSQPDKPATYCRGYFNAEDGKLMLFVRRVVGSTEAVEIEVKEFKVR